jgi:hypothetical protein
MEHVALFLRYYREAITSMGYTLTDLEMALVKLYTQAEFIEWEGRLPGEQYTGDEVRHIQGGWAKMEAGREQREHLALLRQHGY